MQPQRGLIVDDQGRPLVANRTAWVVSVDRTLLGRLSARPSARSRCAGSPTRSGAADGPAGARHLRRRRRVHGHCWNGSPYQPVPVATDVRQAVALRILEQPEDYPAVLAAAAERALLPRARTA